MVTTFVNRTRELADLDALSRKGGLVVVYGRRRVGKTRLVTKWLGQKGGFIVRLLKGSATFRLTKFIRISKGIYLQPCSPRGGLSFSS